MTRTRLELLQWFALFAGPWAWAAQHVLAFGVSNADCAVPVASWDVPDAWLQAGLALIVGLVVLGAEGAAFLVYRATSDVGEYAPGPYGRLRFFAEAALLGNVLFLVIVVLDAAGAIHHSCRGS